MFARGTTGLFIDLVTRSKSKKMIDHVLIKMLSDCDYT